MTLFKDRYRVETARLRGWNYAQQGVYFVTICTKGRAHWFGEIRRGIMGLSGVGCIVNAFWESIPEHFPHVSLDAFVVMPNHVHGILMLERAPPIANFTAPMSRIHRPIPGSIGSIIGQWKTTCTKRIWSLGCTDFGWQPRFHDSVVQTDHALENIRSYIQNNPRMWERDRNYVH
ncbi:MAG: hypothetical protein Greene041662_81 [Candidatus Peregrinibacteria bacterium Greene0416_62]|nr:MAG: hypothetical protein Greene041662_81 [Candidatus Peregrinibacteria bacterium Greene0416_62]